MRKHIRQAYLSANKNESLFQGVRTALPAHTLAILSRLAPGGYVKSGEYVALSPLRADRHVGSFKFNIRKGIGADFATGWKGDLIDLAAALSGGSKLEGARNLARMMGMEVSGHD